MKVTFKQAQSAWQADTETTWDARINARGREALIEFYNSNWKWCDQYDIEFDESDLKSPGRLMGEAMEFLQQSSSLMAEDLAVVEICSYNSRSGNPVCLYVEPEYFDWFLV